MVSEAVEKVREAERESEETIKRARADGKKLVAEAHEEAERLFEAMRKSARESEDSLVAGARSEAEAEAEAIAGGSRSDVEAARGSAEARVADGVSRVVRAITGAV